MHVYLRLCGVYIVKQGRLNDTCQVDATDFVAALGLHVEGNMFGLAKVKYEADVHSAAFQKPFPTLDAVLCKHGLNINTLMCSTIEFIFMLGEASRPKYGLDEIPGNVVVKTWRFMDLLEHNNQLPAEKNWPFEGEGEVQSECCAAESFKYLFSRARLGSSISSSVVETSTIPVMLSTWGGASEVMCSLASWFTIGPHVACLKDLQSRDAEVADIDSYFSSAGGTLAHRVGVYEFDKDRSGGMQTGAYIKSDAFDVRVLKVEKDGKGSSKAADRALMHSGGDHAGMVQDAQMHSLQGVRQEMVNHCTANENGADCVVHCALFGAACCLPQLINCYCMRLRQHSASTASASTAFCLS